MLSWLRRWLRWPAARAAAAAEDAGGADEGERGAAGATLSDELDLHTFLPKECADVVEEYVRAAQEAGLPAVRIIHGKGKGTLRRTVHAVLARHPAVRTYRLAGAERGSWGATLVELKPPAVPPGGGGDA